MPDGPRRIKVAAQLRSPRRRLREGLRTSAEKTKRRVSRREGDGPRLEPAFRAAVGGKEAGPTHKKGARAARTRPFSQQIVPFPSWEEPPPPPPRARREHQFLSLATRPHSLVAATPIKFSGCRSAANPLANPRLRGLPPPP